VLEVEGVTMTGGGLVGEPAWQTPGHEVTVIVLVVLVVITVELFPYHAVDVTGQIVVVV